MPFGNLKERNTLAWHVIEVVVVEIPNLWCGQKTAMVYVLHLLFPYCYYFLRFLHATDFTLDNGTNIISLHLLAHLSSS